MKRENDKRNEGATMKSLKFKNKVFYWCVAFLPLFMFVFDMVFINFNSIMLAFKEYLPDGTVNFVGFKNFEKFFKEITTGAYKDTVLRSVFLYLITLVVTSLIPILFSYFLYHKYRGSGFFKVILFLPSIISSVCTVLIFKFLAERVFPTTFNIENLLSEKNRFTTILIYTLWMQFGSGLLVQLGAMNATEKEVVEAGYIDGVGFWGELWHIVLPKSYSILSIGMITGVISIFTNDFGLYTFYGNDAQPDVWTLGYCFLAETAKSTEYQYPYLAAWGLTATVICAPLTFFVKWLVEHIGPSED